MHEGVSVGPRALGVCRVQEKDPAGALHKVLSCDLRGLQEGEIRPGLLLHPKGQFRALLAVARVSGELWLLAPATKGPELASALDVYLRFSRVLVAPMEGPRFLLLGAGAAAWLGAQGLPCPAPGHAMGDGKVQVFAETLLGLPGLLVAGLEAPDVPAMAEEELERDRLAAGFPAWGRELVPDVLPQEVGLREPWVSLTKGCYVGQETMARLATYGHVNRLLVGLSGDGEAPAAALPWPLADSESARVVGRVTSTARTPDGGLVALGLLHRSVARQGYEAVSGNLRLRVEAVLA
ncbi:MAG: YgfZ/GcvT domain-containing protein [Thermoanaerobaculum sp.]